MAGNFWKSSHYEQWMLDKGDLLRDRGDDLKIYTEEEYQKLMIFFTNFIQAMGQCQEKELSQPINEQSREKPILRMQAIATACVYFRRFYARRSLRDIDPFLLAVTCINLASKVEEMGHLSPNKLINAFSKAARKWPVIESLIQHHHNISNLQDLKNANVQNLDQLCQDAWRVCNDSFRSDVALLYPPHMIAVASIMVAAIMNGREKEKEMRNWLADLNVDYEKIFDIQQIIFNTYRVWRSFDEQTQLRGLIEKLPRPYPTQQVTGGASQAIHMQ